MQMCTLQLKLLPVEEWLAGLTVAPDIVVEMQVVPISMARVNLHMNKRIITYLMHTCTGVLKRTCESVPLKEDYQEMARPFNTSIPTTVLYYQCSHLTKKSKSSDT
jgi:hypothetical protein